MLSDKLFFGTSGWSYKEWVGPFYTKEDKSLLQAYTRVFKTVEIDSTFYRYPSKGIVMGWTRYSPEGFVYAAKLPKLITHEKKLCVSQGVEQDLQRFIDVMEPLWLNGKLACVLIQLPPRFNYQPQTMEDFFRILPATIRFAVEFRNSSWMRTETWDLLEKYNVAYTIVDEPLLPPEVHLTSDIAYFRWHGRGSGPWYNYRYTQGELNPWVPKIQETVKKVEKVFGYFNNHYRGHAVENCLQVLETLGIETPQQKMAKTRIENYRRTAAEEIKLEAFGEPKDMSFEELLRHFTAAARLERARDIPDDDVKITVLNDDRVEAEIKDYHAVIDVKARTILHDCADWEKVMSTRKLCKHIAKLLLLIDREKARAILSSMYSEKEGWRFNPYPDQERQAQSDINA